MDIYNRGQWDYDANAQTITQSRGFWGATKTASVYDEEPKILLGRADGAFIAVHDALPDEQGFNSTQYPYLVSFCLQPYTFEFLVPDFVSILIFCREFHQLVTEQNALLPF